MSAEAWSAWYICLLKGTEKTAELWNRVVFIRGFQRSESPEQLFPSLPIASKHIVPIYYSRNSKVKISSDGGAGRAQGTEASALSLLSLKLLGTRQEWVPQFLHCLPKPCQDSEKWKSFKEYRNTECPSQQEGSLHLNLLGGFVPALLTGSPGVGRPRAITNRNLKAPFSGIWSGNQLCQIFSKYLYPTILHSTWKQVILLWLH